MMKAGTRRPDETSKDADASRSRALPLSCGRILSSMKEDHAHLTRVKGDQRRRGSETRRRKYRCRRQIIYRISQIDGS